MYVSLTYVYLICCIYSICVAKGHIPKKTGNGILVPLADQVCIACCSIFLHYEMTVFTHTHIVYFALCQLLPEGVKNIL